MCVFFKKNDGFGVFFLMQIFFSLKKRIIQVRKNEKWVGKLHKKIIKKRYSIIFRMPSGMRPPSRIPVKPRRGLMLITPYKRSAVRGEKNRPTSELRRSQGEALSSIAQDNVLRKLSPSYPSGWKPDILLIAPWKGSIFIFNNMLPFQGANWSGRILRPNASRWATIERGFQPLKHLRCFTGINS